MDRKEISMEKKTCKRCGTEFFSDKKGSLCRDCKKRRNLIIGGTAVGAIAIAGGVIYLKKNPEKLDQIKTKITPHKAAKETIKTTTSQDFSAPKVKLSVDCNAKPSVPRKQSSPSRHTTRSTMDLKEKAQKRADVKQYVDMSNSRFKDEELNKLHNFVENKEKYNNASKTIHHRFTDWSSDGKYTRDESTTYKVVFDDGSARILEKNVFKDDDGFGGTHEYEHTRARDILELLDTVFRDLEI